MTRQTETTAQLTKGERRFLASRTCAWCGHRLDWSGCGAIYEACSDETRAKRRAAALATYKPRKALAA